MDLSVYVSFLKFGPESSETVWFFLSLKVSSLFVNILVIFPLYFNVKVASSLFVSK